MKGQRTLKSISVFFVFCLGLASAIASTAASGNDGGRDRIGDIAGALRGTSTGTVTVPEKQVCSSWAGVNINLTQKETEALFQCGENTTLAPLQTPEHKIYVDENWKKPTALQTAVPGAKWEKVSDEKPSYRLTLPLHREKKETLYYRCKSAGLIVVEIVLVWIIIQLDALEEEQKDKIKKALEQIKEFVTRVKAALDAVIAKIRQAIQYIKEQIKNAVEQLLKREDVKKFLKDVYDAIIKYQEQIRDAVNKLVEKIQEKLAPIKEAIATVVEKIRSRVTAIVEQITNKTGKTCKVTIVAEPEPLATTEDSTKICSATNNSVYLKISPSETEAVFKCGDNRTTVEPQQSEDKKQFCKSADCKETTDLSEAFPGAYWDDRNKAAHIYRLVIPTEERKDTRMYYKCKGASDSADPCTVLISVKSTETDDHVEEEDVQECTVGTEKKVTLSPTDTVKFKCNLGTVVQPSFSSGSPEVFDDSDGSCSARASLTSLVDASLTEDSSHDKYTKYTMNLKARPAETKNLCLQCSSGKQNCKVRIHVPATDSTSSGAGSLSGFLSSVVGLVVCVGFFLVH
ncbi:SAG-related sequence SRS59B [Toxoplasma gondii RUB]|uniref:SAG-related sequence SRS59B n=1 Tax=Toxoplasma gondii RUB TaxID=935652 RepID=A0A086LLW5_TOXGO|nr:SAG-related sequence SRS59B [Toxoplasma gondii RUB]